MLVLLWLFNLAISFFNAWAVGKGWAEAKAQGGWSRFMAYMGATMTAIGFVWCFLLLEVFGLRGVGLVTDHMMVLALEIGWVMLAPVLLGSGLAITVDSWGRAYRNGGVLDYGIAAYNTYAQIHNTVAVVDSFGGALSDIFSSIGDAAPDSDDANVTLGFWGIVIVLAVVGAAFAAGIGLTVLLIRRFAASSELPSFNELKQRRGITD